MVQRRYLILTGLLLLIAGAGAGAQLPDGTIKISGIRPAEVRFTSDGRYFMAKLSDTLRIYETATGVQAGGIPVPKVDGYAAGFLAGDSTVLVMRYNWGLYYHVWNWRKGVLVDSQKVWRQVQWAHVLGSGRKMVIKVPETTDPTKQYEMWNTIGEATYLGSFLDTSFKGHLPMYDANGESAVSFVVAPQFSNRFVVRIQIHPRLTDRIDTVPVSAQPFREFYISPDGNRILVTRASGVQRVFDGLTLDSLFVVDIPKVSRVIASFDFTPGNQWLLCMAAPDTGLPRFEIRDAVTGAAVRTIAADTSIRYMQVQSSPTGSVALLYQPSATEGFGDVYIVPVGLSVTSVEGVTGDPVVGIQVYPNPAVDEVHVNCGWGDSGITRICLVTADGHEVVTRESVGCGERLETKGLPAGACFIIVEHAGIRTLVPLAVHR